MTALSTSPGRVHARQRGLSLIIVMVILVVVTVLGIGGARIALLGERSTRYDRDYLVASQAAEAALTDAEYDINSTIGTRNAKFVPGDKTIFITGCGTGANLGLCAPVTVAGSKPVWTTVDFLNTGGPTVEFGAFTGRVFSSGVGIAPERKPRYIIEQVLDQTPGGDAKAGPPLKYMYRITAIGFGPRKEVQVVMQTAFRKVMP